MIDAFLIEGLTANGLAPSRPSAFDSCPLRQQLADHQKLHRANPWGGLQRRSRGVCKSGLWRVQQEKAGRKAVDPQGAGQLCLRQQALLPQDGGRLDPLDDA